MKNGTVEKRVSDIFGCRYRIIGTNGIKGILKSMYVKKLQDIILSNPHPIHEFINRTKNKFSFLLNCIYFISISETTII